MDEYRRQQAARWAVKPKPEVVEEAASAEVLKIPEEVTADSWTATHLVIDATSLDSIIGFIKDTGGKVPRTGILYGVPGVDYEGLNAVVVDAIYEVAQDTSTGEPLRDTRAAMVGRVSENIGIHPVGILITTEEAQPLTVTKAADLVRAACVKSNAGARGNQGFKTQHAHVVLMISVVGPEYRVAAVALTQSCLAHHAAGVLTASTSLTGQTVRGGLDGITLQRPLEIMRRQVNQVIHTGFYRLNRPNHTPTLDDVRACILARRNTAKIGELHKQLADYHLLLFIADTLGESAAERAIIAIFTEEDELVEDLVGLLMASA